MPGPGDLDRGAHATLRRASAGRRRAARQPPNAPAMRPPSTASPIAIAMTRDRHGCVEHDLGGGARSIERPGRRSRRRRPARIAAWPATRVRPRRASGRRRCRRCVGAMRLTTQMPTSPSTRPAAPPMSPCTSDSPATCPTMRRFDQPIALSVPNSRVRRVTPWIVKQDRDEERGDEHGDRQPQPEVRDEARRGRERARDRRGEVGLRRHGRVGQCLLDVGLHARRCGRTRWPARRWSLTMSVSARDRLGEVERDVDVRRRSRRPPRSRSRCRRPRTPCRRRRSCRRPRARRSSRSSRRARRRPRRRRMPRARVPSVERHRRERPDGVGRGVDARAP